MTPGLPCLHLRQTLTAKYSSQVSALLTIYRLLDLELLHHGPEYPVVLLLCMEILYPPKCWRRSRLGNAGRNSRIGANCLSTSGIVFSACLSEKKTSNHLKHLNFAGLLHIFRDWRSHILTRSSQTWFRTFVAQPFIGPYYTKPTHEDTNDLAIMPEALSSIIDQKTLFQIHQGYLPHTREKISTYLQRHSQGELVLPLHLSLMLTPCFLLMTITLVKCKFPRQAIYQVSAKCSTLVCLYLTTPLAVMCSRKSEARYSYQSREGDLGRFFYHQRRF